MPKWNKNRPGRGPANTMDTMKMDKFDVGTYLKEAKAKLDDETVKGMDKLLQELTTSGSLSLDANVMKKYKKFCRKSDDCVSYAFFSIMKQLMKKHSEIRLSAFQMMDELFNRSHAFRELLITHLQTFLALTTEIEVKQPLPPPKAAANKLKTDTLHALQQWYEKFGQGYRKLAIGYDYLKNCKHINFDDIRAQNEAERQRLEEEEKRKQKIMADRLAKIMKEISEFKPEILDCAKEAESCLQLLLPTPEDFLLPAADFSTSHARDDQPENKTSITQNESDNEAHKDSCSQLQNFDTSKERTETTPTVNEDDDEDDVNCDGSNAETESMEEDSDDEMDDLHAHGFVNPSFSVTVQLPGPNGVSVTETTDNTDVMQSLKDSSKLISSSYLPRVTKWLEVLSKNGAKEEDIKSAIDLKVHLEELKRKCVQLKLVSQDKVKAEEDSDDDFEDVPEKEGFEPRIPHHLREEYGLTEGPSSSGSSQSGLKRSLSATESGKKQNSETVFWSLKERGQADIVDPTSRAAALANIKPQHPDPSTSSSQSPTGNEAGTSKTGVPVVEFGRDIAHWENPDEMEAPLVMKYDSLHRFWTPSEFESEKATKEQMAAVCNRTFSFSGTFEPVKWKCRALLPSGSLCERMDRFKCPFHGKIIARDEHGQPSGEAFPSITQSNSSTEASGMSVTEELPPWQDPQLQKEIEAATGHDLGSARSQKLLDKAARGKGKGRGKRTKSNLTDIHASKNAGRKRLEKRVFNRTSMRKVCATLDRADYKRVRDKFGNQFNYSLH